jgi:DNA-binding CsgD family transcriptional regulator
VLFVNKIAEELFRDGAGLRLRDNVLAAEIYSESERLQRMIAESHSAECFRDGALSTLEISRGAGRRSLSVLVAPLRMARNDTFLDDAYSIVIIKDSDARKKPPASILRSRFSLTTAEARLALEILNGDGIAAAARRLSVSQTTARTHLAQVFAKTGTRRQAELVRILLELM